MILKYVKCILAKRVEGPECYRWSRCPPCCQTRHVSDVSELTATFRVLPIYVEGIQQIMFSSDNRILE